MSFIFGIVNLDQRPVEPQELEDLGKAVQWPDFTQNVQIVGPVGLGICTHPRMKQEGGFISRDGYFGVANVKIYHTDQEIMENGQDDADRFLQAWQRWGESCIDHVNGDFAIVIVEAEKRKVHLFRDHFGVRPLVYFYDHTRLLFASHEFGLAYSGLFRARLSERGIMDRFLRNDNYRQSLFERVFKVLPGHVYNFGINNQTVHKIWDPSKIRVDTSLTAGDAVGKLKTLLIRAVDLRYDQTLKTGVHVSGGLDSGGIASILAKVVSDPRKLTAYSYTPREHKYSFEGSSEKIFIDDFTKDTQLPVNFVRYDETEFLNDQLIPEMEKMYLELPVMRMAEKDEVDSIFSGWGGDEFITLSTRGILNYLVFGMHFRGLLNYIREKGIKTVVARTMKEILPSVIPLWSQVFNRQPSYMKNDLFLNREARKKHVGSWSFIRKDLYGYGNRFRFMINLMEMHHIAWRIDSWTLLGEKYGLRYQYPLLDKELIEFWFTVPIPLTIAGWESRILFREALKGTLTDSIRLRPTKDEAIRFTHTIRNTIEGLSYLADEYEQIQICDHLEIFNHEKFNEMISRIRSNNVEFDGRELLSHYPDFFDAGRLAFYLRMFRISQKLK